MRYRTICLLGAAWSVLSIADTVFGQPVFLGPPAGVRVAAPFVRVYVGPGGETWVRAPFTSVYSPGYLRRMPGGRLILGGQRPVVADETLDAMTWRQLRNRLRQAARRLGRDLDRVRQGGGWRQRLQPGLLSDLVAADIDLPPDAEVAEQLQGLLAEYEAVGTSTNSASISRLQTFREVRAMLNEYLTPPQVRQRRQLAATARQLDRELRRFATGDDWQAYLALPAGVFTDDRRSVAAGNIPDSSVSYGEQLQQVLERFASVGGNRDYQMIAALPSFKQTEVKLAAYIASLGSAELGARSPAPVIEELPAPAPIP